MTIYQGDVVVKVFVTNSSYIERMRLLLDRSVETDPDPAAEVGKERMGGPTGALEEIAV